MDEDVTNHDIIGSAKVDIMQFCSFEGKSEWLQLAYEDKDVGSLEIAYKFIEAPKPVPKVEPPKPVEQPKPKVVE